MLTLAYQDSPFLIPGDTYTAADQDIVVHYGDNLHTNKLKAPHHGASTSSSKPFREAVNPQVVVMMHDAIAALRIYRNYRRLGAQPFITSVDGAVLVSTAWEGEYKVNTQFARHTDFLDSADLVKSFAQKTA